ncbi:MAG TPA: hypothetical protein VFV50_02580 [Bdellovibrionales bacterium]|nr:hypothetical protein [Bdellovibrionales bacterium]
MKHLAMLFLVVLVSACANDNRNNGQVAQVPTYGYSACPPGANCGGYYNNYYTSTCPAGTVAAYYPGYGVGCVTVPQNYSYYYYYPQYWSYYNYSGYYMLTYCQVGSNTCGAGYGCTPCGTGYGYGFCTRY